MTYEDAIRDTELIKTLEARRDAIQDWIDGLKDGVKGFLAENGATSMMLGTHKVSHIEFTARRFDSRKFKDEHDELYNQYEITSTVKRFTIN